MLNTALIHQKKAFVSGKSCVSSITSTNYPLQGEFLQASTVDYLGDPNIWLNNRRDTSACFQLVSEESFSNITALNTKGSYLVFPQTHLDPTVLIHIRVLNISRLLYKEWGQVMAITQFAWVSFKDTQRNSFRIFHLVNDIHRFRSSIHIAAVKVPRSGLNIAVLLMVPRFWSSLKRHKPSWLQPFQGICYLTILQSTKINHYCGIKHPISQESKIDVFSPSSGTFNLSNM